MSHSLHPHGPSPQPPTRDSIEAWFVDRLDGTLSPEQCAQMDAFLEQHPDLKAEWTAWTPAAWEEAVLPEATGLSLAGTEALLSGAMRQKEAAASPSVSPSGESLQMGHGSVEPGVDEERPLQRGPKVVPIWRSRRLWTAGLGIAAALVVALLWFGPKAPSGVEGHHPSGPAVAQGPAPKSIEGPAPKSIQGPAPKLIDGPAPKFIEVPASGQQEGLEPGHALAGQEPFAASMAEGPERLQSQENESIKDHSLKHNPNNTVGAQLAQAAIAEGASTEPLEAAEAAQAAPAAEGVQARSLNQLGLSVDQGMALAHLEPRAEDPLSPEAVQAASGSKAEASVDPASSDEGWLAKLSESMPARLPKPLREGVEATAQLAENMEAVLDGERRLLQGRDRAGQANGGAAVNGGAAEDMNHGRNHAMDDGGRVFRLNAGPFRITHRRPAKAKP